MSQINEYRKMFEQLVQELDDERNNSKIIHDFNKDLSNKFNRLNKETKENEQNLTRFLTRELGKFKTKQEYKIEENNAIINERIDEVVKSIDLKIEAKLDEKEKDQLEQIEDKEVTEDKVNTQKEKYTPVMTFNSLDEKNDFADQTN